jgi:hypothetical protein
MNKIIVTLLIASFLVVSCSKEDKGGDEFARELFLESPQLIIATSGAEKNIQQELIRSNTFDYYTAGELEYLLNGQAVAKVNFGNGTENSLAELDKDGEITSIDLKKDESYYDGKKSKFKKVIIEPLVKAEDCSFVIAGIIKYYDIDTDAWLATIDYGDFECDQWATKTTADSDEPYVFSLNDWQK